MKTKILSFFIIIIVCLAGFIYDQWSQNQRPHYSVAIAANHAVPVPNFDFTTLNGQTYSLVSLPENGILLHFWASWCPPCLVELPHLLERIEKSQGRLALVAVSLDNDKDALQRFISSQTHQTTHVYWVWDQDKSISLKLFNTTTPPETILIDNQRFMVDKFVGDPGWMDADMQVKLERLTRR